MKMVCIWIIIRCYFAFLSMVIFVFFTRYSLRYLSLKLYISSIDNMAQLFMAQLTEATECFRAEQFLVYSCNDSFRERVFCCQSGRTFLPCLLL